VVDAIVRGLLGKKDFVRGSQATQVEPASSSAMC
jgi:hypothetical protein